MPRTARVTRARTHAKVTRKTAGTRSAAVGRGSAVARTSSRSRRPSLSRGSLEARCRSVFTTGLALLIALTSLGLARVAVIARAAEVTISTDSLAKLVKEQRVETDQLEVDKSSLSAPSRIEAIAADTMSMGDPASVSYITMPAGEAGAEGTTGSAAGQTAEGERPSTSARLASVMSALLDVSAGEAQSLLVGDLALAGSR